MAGVGRRPDRRRRRCRGRSRLRQWPGPGGATVGRVADPWRVTAGDPLRASAGVGTLTGGIAVAPEIGLLDQRVGPHLGRIAAWR